MSLPWLNGGGEMADRVRAHAWAATPLGPAAEWDGRLQGAVAFTLASPLVASVAVGPERRLIYNDAAARLYGERHPAALGAPLGEAFADSFPAVAAVYDRVFVGENVTVKAQPLAVGPDGAEVFDAYLTPVRDAGGAVIAAQMIGFEIGEQVRADRDRTATIARLRENETMLRVALSGGRMGSWRWDRAADLIRGDAQFMALWGLPPTDAALPLATFAARMTAEGAAEMVEVVTRAPAAGEEFAGPLAIVGGPTAGRWVQWQGRADADDPTVLYGVTFDITAQKDAQARLQESEDRQTFLLRLSDALRPLTDPGEVERTATRLLGEHLGADRCFLSPVYDDGSGMCVREEYLRAGGSSVLGDYTFAQFDDFVGPELHAGNILAVEDVAALTDLSSIERASYASTGISAYLLVPLVRDGRLAAFLTVNHRTPRMWSEADRAVARQTADRLWTARERGRVGTALRESEARLQKLVEASNDVMFTADAAWQEMRPLAHGQSSATIGPARDWLTAFVPASEHERLRAAIRAAKAERLSFELEHRTLRADGTPGWALTRAVPLLAEDGTVREWFGAASDVTDRREIEETLRLTLELVPAMLWWADPKGKMISANARWLTFTGQSRAETQDFGWLAAIHPDDAEATHAAFARAFATGEPLERQQRIHQGADGYRWHLVRHVPVRDEAGTITNWFGAAVDIHELHELQERQGLLVAELQHRTRNLLGVMRSVFARTVEAGGSIEDIADHFKGRLDALGRTQVIVTQNARGTADLENLIRDELLSVGVHADGAAVTIDGPDVALPAKTAEMIGMAIHELTTNAMKYGAIAHTGATLSISWRVNADYIGPPRLDLYWIEQGVPAVPLSPERYGFGRELIEEALPYRLNAEARLTFRGGGVRCAISMPLPEWGASAAQGSEDR